jgi:biopolymer transport protein ExbB/TolQ
VVEDAVHSSFPATEPQVDGSKREDIDAMGTGWDDTDMTKNPSESSLRIMGHIATLTGLAGTVVGMVTTFDDFTKSEAPPGLDVLLKGIGISLLVTLSLLVFVVPLMAFWLYRQKN